MASGRTCSTYSHRAWPTSSYAVEVGAGKGSTPVRDEEASLLDCLYHGPVSQFSLIKKDAENRMIALQLGRPSGIADKDIDIEFPLNIDLQVTDPAHIFEMQNRQIEITKDKYPGAEYTKGYDQVNSVRLSQ